MIINNQYLEDALYVFSNYLKQENYPTNTEIFCVWSCKTLQNYKCLLATTVDNHYYELTYNGDNNEWYIDTYDKIQNIKVKISSTGDLIWN